MVKEAEQFAEEDKRRREQANQLNDADAICYQGERFIADFGAKVPAETRRAIETQITELKAAITKKDAADATAKAQALKTALQQAGASIYREAGAPPTAEAAKPGESAGTASGQRVVDAQFRETK